jgi:hypothetical protein
MMVTFIGLERRILVMASQAYRRTQLMFCKPLLRVWRMSYNGQMQRKTAVFLACLMVALVWQM